MAADIIAGVIVLLAGVTGALAGTLPSIVRLVVVLFAGGLGWLIGPELATFFQGTSGEGEGKSLAFGFLLTFAVFWAVVTFAVRRFFGLDVERRPSGADRAGGFLFGLVKGAALAYFFMVCGLLLWSEGAGVNLGWNESKVGEVVGEYNFLAGDHLELTDHAIDKAIDHEEWIDPNLHFD